MKKIVRQQNYFRELIDSQANKFLTRQSLKCLLKSAIEPLLDDPESGVVFHRIDNKDGLAGLLKRLEFSEVEAFNFSDESGNLVEKVWANTEFLFVMTHRYVAILIWDNNTADKNYVRYYSLYNSKLQSEPLDILKRNSKVDIAPYQEKYNPDRRDNKLLNVSIRKLLTNMEEAGSDAVLGYAEKAVETFKESDYTVKKSRVVAHEIRNQLSICDLYSEIIRKCSESGDVEAVQKALKSINKALKMANNALLDLKSNDGAKIEAVSVRTLIETSIELSKVYLEGKGIDFEQEISEDFCILADEDKLTAVIINLVKNAVEAFGFDETEENSQNGKYIKIKAEKEEDFGVISVSNNAEGIKTPEKIFNEGFTTKSTGSGLGLWICQKSVEEMMGILELSRSSEDFTEFSIKLGLKEQV